MRLFGGTVRFVGREELQVPVGVQVVILAEEADAPTPLRSCLTVPAYLLPRTRW